jgi:DNA mismatch endonuclease Vsr
MADRITPEQRSRNMSRIRSRDTKPELALRTELYKLGLRYRLCRRDLPGAPDIAFSAQRVAVQVRGCFWHQHPGCGRAHVPRSNEHYWQPKLKRTIARDAANDTALKKLGWAVIELWECELLTEAQVEKAAQRISRRLVRRSLQRR